MISIIIANYNKEHFVRETVESVIAQTNPGWEVIFVDDGSTDNSLEAISNLASQDQRIRVLKTTKEKRGANVARNIGWRAAAYSYVMFLDSDDVLAPSCVASRLDCILKNKLDFNVFVGGTFIDSVGDRHQVWRPKNTQHLESFLRHDLPWHTTSVLWRKSSLDKIGGFSEDLSRLQDVELHTRALLCGLEYVVMNELNPDFFYRVSPQRTTFDAYELGKRYAASCQAFQASALALIQSSAYEETKKRRCLRRLRGTTLSMMCRFSIDYSNGQLTKSQRGELQTELEKSASKISLFKGALYGCLTFYKFLINIGTWKLRGFTKITKLLIA